MNKKWTIEEENYLKANANDFKDEELAKELTNITGKKFTKIAIRRKRQKLGLVKARGRGKSEVISNFLYDGNIDHLG